MRIVGLVAALALTTSAASAAGTNPIHERAKEMLALPPAERGAILSEMEREPPEARWQFLRAIDLERAENGLRQGDIGLQDCERKGYSGGKVPTPASTDPVQKTMNDIYAYLCGELARGRPELVTDIERLKAYLGE